MPRMPTEGVALLLVAIACAACEPTPDVTFDSEDGSPPATSPTGDGSSGGQPVVDASPGYPLADGAPSARDAGSAGPDAASPVDAAGPLDTGVPPDDAGGSTNQCPQPPPGADTCCGNIPCVGKKCTSRCSECNACQAGQICCVPNGNGVPIACVASANDC